MTDTELIEALRARVQDENRRTDFSHRQALYVPPSPPQIAPRISADDLTEAERRLGFTLHPLHRRLFIEIGNGGFGPGNGLLGLQGGHTDDEGRSVFELRELLGADEDHPGLPDSVLPLCDFGGGMWACLDESTGNVLTAHEGGLTDTGQSFANWLADWVQGVNLLDKMFVFEEHAAINPFTKKPMVVRTPTRAVGDPYKRIR
jgi:hypothetical protein